MDPISDRFPWVSTYNYAENYPTGAIDLHGLQKLVTTVYEAQRVIQNDGKYNFSVNQIGPSSTTNGGNWSGYKQNNVFFFEGEQVSSLNDIEGYREWSDFQSAEEIRTVGKALELGGDLLTLGGLVATLVQPEIGIPVAKAGETMSLTGTGLQVTADVKQEKYGDASKRILIEAVSIGASSGIAKAIDKSGIDAAASTASKGTEEILQSRADLAIEVIKNGVKQKEFKEKDE